MIARIVGTVIGLILFVASIPLAISPIPLGALLMVVAIIILVSSNPLAARLLRFLRGRYGWLDRLFCQMERVLPVDFAEPLRSTNGHSHRKGSDDGDENDDDAPSPPAPRTSADGPKMMRRTGYPRYLK